MLLRHLVDWASHVDVNEFGTVVDRPARRFGKWILGVAVELHAAGGVMLIGGSEFEGPAGTHEDGAAIEEIRAREPDAPLLPAEHSECEIAVARDGSEQQWCLKLEWADLHVFMS